MLYVNCKHVPRTTTKIAIWIYVCKTRKSNKFNPIYQVFIFIAACQIFPSKKIKKEQEKLKTKVVYMQIFNYDA